MINLVFLAGSSIRHIAIDKKKVTFITPEFNFVPYTVDLTKIDSDVNEKLGKILSEKEKDDIKLLSEKGNEKQIADDIVKDFELNGWKLAKWD